MPDSDAPNDLLLPLARTIAEGVPVDDHAVARNAGQGADRGVLDALMDIAAIGAAHRDAERGFDRQAPPPLGPPRRWGHLTILERIAAGEFGEVYRAHDERLQIDVALKLSSEAFGRSPDASCLLEEARLLARVRHPNVVRVHGADHKAGRVGMWMEQVKGQTLEELARTQGFSAAEAVNAGIELCRALAAVHATGVLHGDIKAHNVVRRDGGQFVLVDFGSGRRMSAEPDPGHDLIGTPVYMAPEVLEGQPRSASSDIYSLGVTLFHLVTNAYPVYAGTIQAFRDLHRSGTRRNLRDLRSDLPEAFIQIVERATASDPRARYRTAGALEAALTQAMAGRVDPVRDRTSLVALGALVTLTLGAGVLWIRPGALPTPVHVDAAGPGDIALPPESFGIDAAFSRRTGGREQRLVNNDQVLLHDRVHLTLRATARTYLYVVNEDDTGTSALLFPDPGHGLTNPLPADTTLRVPAELDWIVDSVGGREHFIVFAGTEELTAFDASFQKLRQPLLPDEKRARLHAGLAGTLQAQLQQDGSVERVRGLSGLVALSAPDRADNHFRDTFTTPLAGPERAWHTWIRQLTLLNRGGAR